MFQIDSAGLAPRTKQWGITKGERRSSPPWASTGIHPPCAVRAIEQITKFWKGFVYLLFFYSSLTQALVFSKPVDGNRIVGSVQTVQLTEEDDYPAIGNRYDVGYYELFEANPGVNEDDPPAATILVIPTQYILPKELHNDAIVINLAEMRLYYESDQKIFIFPIGIGNEGWNTPIGNFHIIEKIKNPTWVAPEALYKYRIGRGDKINRVMPPGPNNPMGSYALRLSIPTYLIHGTDDPIGIGRRSSAGCIRLYPKDIEKLFAMVKVGTKVVIINSPYKAAVVGTQIYFEAHMPLYEQRRLMRGDLSSAIAVVRMVGEQYYRYTNWLKVEQIAREHLGIPEVVGKIPSWTPIKSELPSLDMNQITLSPTVGRQLNGRFWIIRICEKFHRL